MRERIDYRDPVYIHDTSVFNDCELCDSECRCTSTQNTAATSVVLANTQCPFCNNTILVLQQVLIPPQEDSATDG